MDVGAAGRSEERTAIGRRCCAIALCALTGGIFWAILRMSGQMFGILFIEMRDLKHSFYPIRWSLSRRFVVNGTSKSGLGWRSAMRTLKCGLGGATGNAGLGIYIYIYIWRLARPETEISRDSEAMRPTMFFLVEGGDSVGMMDCWISGIGWL